MKECLFCNIEETIEKERIIYQDSTWIAFYDKYPVSKGHVLLVPKRHAETFFDINEIEYDNLGLVIDVIKTILDNRFHPDGYNIGVNCGEAAGQTVMHCHIHIIPRYEGDMADPRGGVRGVIPEKQKY
jgi:diadenosine tetraphosphate (Ap4A) HIT family hydrolase